MKYSIKLSIIILCLYSSFPLAMGQVGINTDNSSPNSSAMLDISSSDKGVLIPRLSSLARLAMSNPADGLMVYDSTTVTYWYYDNNQWNEIRNGSNKLSGNDLTDILPNFNCSEVRSSFPIGTAPKGVVVSGNFAYVVDRESNDLKVINVSNPASPFLAGSVAIGSEPRDVVISGNYAYVVDVFSRDLKVIDVSNPSSPEVVDSLVFAEGLPTLAISGNYVYVVEDDLKIVDVSTPTNPILIDSINFGIFPFSVAVSDHYAYVLYQFPEKLGVINVSNPSDPVAAGSLSIGPSPRGVAVSGNYAYVLTSTNVQVIDVSTPASPVLVQSIAIGPNHGIIEISGNYVYVTDANNKTLQVIDVSNPLSPALVGSIAIGPTPRSMTILNDYAYVVDEISDDLKVIEIKTCPSFLTVDPISGSFSTTSTDTLGAALPSGLSLQGDGGILNLQASTANSASFSQWYNHDQSVHGIIGADGQSFSGTTGQFSIATWTNHPIRFFTYQIPRMIIDANGAVGIGTATPNSTLEVNGTLTATSFSGNGAALTNIPGENLGNHTATQSLNLANNPIINGGNITATSFTGSGAGLTNLPGRNDNLGNHIATSNIQLGVNWLSRDGTNDGIAISPDGNVGIGLNFPTQGRLDVDGTGNLNFFSYGYLNSTGATGFFNNGVNVYSIYASGRIASAEFNAFSDARIKNIIGKSDTQEDLNTLMGIQITDYQHIDTIQKGSKLHKKVIAQQVADVFPQAVSNSTREVIPDIYQRAMMEDNWICLTTNLQVGERVKIITPDSFRGSKDIYEVTEVEAGRFKVSDLSSLVSPLFVYGREVDDFHTVDYEEIAMLNVSATQEQQRKLEALQKRVKVLKAENTQLKNLAKKIAEIETLLLSQAAASDVHQ